MATEPISTMPSARRRTPIVVDGTGRGSSSRVNVPRVAAGVAVVAVCALVGLSVLSSVDHRRSVLMVTRPLTPGETLTAADVRVVRVTTEAGVRTIPASRLSAVVGRRAAMGLPAGSLLNPDGLASGAGLPAGTVAMGVSLKPGMYPSTARAGDTVIVLVVTNTTTGTAASDAAPAGGPVRAQVTRVTAAPASAGGSGSTVDLLVPEGDAARIAEAATAGRVVLAVAP